MIGRDAALAQLSSLLGRARAGQGGLALVQGEAGIGKTRLVEALATRAARDDVLLVWGRAWEAGGAPAYWPLVEVLRGLLRLDALKGPALERRRATLSLLLPELAPLSDASVPPLPAREARFALMDALVGALCDAAREAPLLVLLEDMHAADVDSLLALELLAAQARASRALVVVTARPMPLDEAGPGAVLARLLRVSHAIGLERLSRDEVQVFLAQVLGKEPSEEAVAALHRTSEGNPLFLTELSRYWATHGRAPELHTLSPRALPQGVRSVIAQRLAGLSDRTRLVLEAASVLGREVDDVLLTALVHDAELDVQAALDEALDLTVLEVVPPRTLRFSHVLLRDVLYAGLAPTRRQQLHRMAADALTRRAEQAPPAWASLAHHLLSAGPDLGERAVEAARSAAEEAERRLAFDEAVTWLERALLAEREAHPEVGPRRAELTLLLARARNMKGDFAGARRTCLEAAEYARALGEPALLARTALEYGRMFVFARVDPALVSLLEEAERALPKGDVGLRARLMARHAAAQQPAVDPRGPIEEARAAVQLARTVNDSAVLLDTLRSATSAMADLGDVRERVALNREFAELCQRKAQPFESLRALSRLCFDYLELGEVRKAESIYREYDRLSRQLGVPHARWFAVGLSSLFATREGRFAEAVRLADEARALGDRASDPNMPRALGLQNVARLRMWGRRREALETMPALKAVLADLEHQVPWLHVMEEALRASLREPRPKLRKDIAERCLSLADPSILVFTAEVAYYTRDRGLAEQVEELFRPRSGTFVSWGAIGLSIDGPIDYWLGLLSEARDALDEAIACFEKALALAEKAGARPYEAWSAFRLARLLEGRAEPEAKERARALRQQASELAAELGLHTSHVDVLEGEPRPALSAAPAPASSRASAPAPRSEPAQAASRSESVPAPSVSSAPPRSQTDGVTLVRRGDYWELAAEGTLLHLEDSKGVRYLAQLLEAPGRSFHVLELSGASLTETDRSDHGPVLDERAVAEYKRRVAELRAQLEEEGEGPRALAVRSELEALEDQLAEGLGLGGRRRRTGSNVERARVNVQRRLRDTLRRIEAQAPDLARRLERAIKTGVTCVYDP